MAPNLALARSIAAEHRDRLATLRPAERALEYDRLIYAALWHEEARAAHIAILPLAYDFGLQRHWRQHRARYHAAADGELFAEPLPEARAAGSYIPAIGEAA